MTRLTLPEVEPEWTPRQREVLDLLVQGQTNSQIAEKLGVSLEGAKFHVSEILSKLQVRSREEAAEYWRHRNGLRTRFLRVGGRVLPSIALKWLAGGAAAGLIVAAGVMIALVAWPDDESAVESSADSPTATASATMRSSPTAVSTSTPGATLTLFPDVTTVTRVSVSRGATITGGYGLLFGNPHSGGVEAWLLPQGSFPLGVSPQGRYFMFADELIDAWTGDRRAVPLSGNPLKATFAPDDSAVVVQTTAEAALLRTDGTIIERFPDFPTERTAEAMWSPDGRAVALSRASDGAARVDVILDGVLQPPLPSSGTTAWSRQGLRLAVTGVKPAIYDYRTGGVLVLERGGTFPAWSGDDAYLATDISDEIAPGLTAIDTRTGKEVLRVYNQSACFSIFWYEGPALPGVSDTGAIAVPSGETIPYKNRPFVPAPRVETGTGMVQWLDGSGRVYAAAKVEAIWAFSFAWVRRDLDTAGFPPVLFLGRGGQDACGGSGAGAVVVRPPFTAAQIPTPTPTPDK